MIERGPESWHCIPGEPTSTAYYIKWGGVNDTTIASSAMGPGYVGTPFTRAQVGWHHSNGVNIAFPDGHVTRHNRIDYMPNYRSDPDWTKGWKTTRFVGDPTSVK